MNKNWLVVLLLLFLFLVGVSFFFSKSSGTRVVSRETQITPTTRSPTDKNSCEQLGGQWKIWSNALNARPKCNLPTSDSGKECTDSSQCESYCQAEKSLKPGSQTTGKCYEWRIADCMREVQGGIFQFEWCH